MFEGYSVPPRVRLSEEDRARLPALLAAVAGRAGEFPGEAASEAQVAWLWRAYGEDEPLSVGLLTLLLFEHGAHRSAETVAGELEAARRAGLLSDG